MNNKGVVIVDGHIQGLSLTRALGMAGIPVVIIDKNISIASFSRYCSKSFRVNDYTGSKFIDFLINLAIKENLTGWSLITTDDSITENISQNKSELGVYYKIIAPDIDILDNIINKRKFLEIGQSLGLSVPKIYSGDHKKLLNFDLKFPVIIKGSYGRKFYLKYNTKAIVCSNYESLKQKIRTLSPDTLGEDYFIQELLPLKKTTRIISFTAFSIQGEIKSHWIGEKVREHPIILGTATMSKSSIVPELYEKCVALLKELDYTGVSEIEFLKLEGDENFYLIEMNPRTWLWVGLAKTCGIDYAIMIYNYLNGKDFEYPKKFDPDYYWVNPLTDIPYSLKGIIRGNYKFSEIINSYYNVKDFSVFKSNDLMPAIMMMILLPYIALKR
ncbi:MAG: hypothetical protein J0L60_13590 [Ignavibacteria bacterium]|nr:hypothetical protein [Ignavibacteria bacterium]